MIMCTDSNCGHTNNGIHRYSTARQDNFRTSVAVNKYSAVVIP